MRLLVLCSWRSVLLMAGVFLALPTGAAPEQAASPPRPVMPPAALPFELKDVRLLDGPFREAMLRDLAYLRSLDTEQLLHTFRLNAGLPTSAKPLGGWEEPKGELRGHSLGHYLSACALMYAATGDKKLRERGDYLVAALARCQQSLTVKGYGRGYLSAFPESFFDRLEKGQPVWAPYYTLHKIMAGLLDVHLLCGNPQALEVVKGMADWVKFRMDRLDAEGLRHAVSGNEFGGMNEVFANLYAVTGNPDHLRLAVVFDDARVFDPLARREDKLDGLHANTQIPKAIGAARQFEMSGQQRYRDVAQFFWERVALHRSYVIGGHSDREHFFPTNEWARHLSAETAETCNTYNMLKLTRLLFGWDTQAGQMDFYEGGLYNHILASQDPKEGMFVYLMSIKPGHFKTYSTHLDSFWCCVGTGMENHAKYGDTIYFHTDDTLYVNLFIASELNWKAKGLVLRQETSFPEQDTTRLSFKCAKPARLALKLRCPSWVAPGFEVKVNGQRAEVEAHPGSYVTLDREWQTGDKLELRLPMNLRLESLPGAPERVALLYGPVVLAGELGTEGLTNFSPYAKRQTDQVRVPTPRVPGFLGKPEDVLAHVEPVPGKPLTFRTSGLGRPQEVTLVPFYKVHHQRYTVYWEVRDEEAWKQLEAKEAAAEAARQALERRTLDAVVPSNADSEKQHEQAGKDTEAGSLNGRGWRHARSGGWFSYRLKVLPDAYMVLQCTYWGSDVGREFDVLVDGAKLTTQKLDNIQPGEFFDTAHPLPETLTRGKKFVTVTFRSSSGKMAGGVFGVRTLKPE
jgi:uncharacterized protein